MLAPILTRLLSFTDELFGREEVIWQKGQLNSIEEHKKSHENLLKTVYAFKRKFDNGEAQLSLEFMVLLRDWLLNHIMKADKEAYISISR